MLAPIGTLNCAAGSSLLIGTAVQFQNLELNPWRQDAKVPFTTAILGGRRPVKPLDRSHGSHQSKEKLPSPTRTASQQMARQEAKQGVFVHGYLRTLIAVVALLVTATHSESASAQTAQKSGAKQCSAYADVIALSLKRASLEEAVSDNEDSAPRAALAETRRQNLLAYAAMNIQLSIANGCSTAAGGPLLSTQYSLKATICAGKQKVVTLRRSIGTHGGSEQSAQLDAEAAAACDMSKW